MFELQQGGDQLLKKVKEIQDEKWRDVKSMMDMLKQESQEATSKVSIDFIVYKQLASYRLEQHPPPP